MPIHEYPFSYATAEFFLCKAEIGQEGAELQCGTPRAAARAYPLRLRFEAAAQRFEKAAQRFATQGALLATNLAGDGGADPYKYGVL